MEARLAAVNLNCVGALILASCSWGLIGVGAHAQETGSAASAKPLDLSAEFQTEVAASGLNNPCGLAVRTGSLAEGPHHVYFSESGAGRIVTILTDEPGELTTAIERIPTGRWEVGAGYEMGPMGAVFITNGKLAVGCGGGDRGRPAVRVFLLDAPGADNEPLTYDEFDHEVLPSPVRGESDDESDDAVNQFFGLANNDGALYAAGGGDAQGNWILMASITKNRLADLQPKINAQQLTGVARPLGITINSRVGKGYLVAGQMGEASAERDSALAFYAPRSGRLAAAFTAGLYDLVDLAYCPSSGNLYAIDAAWHDPQVGGVYRLDAQVVDGQQTCQPVKIADCVRPTSLAFTPAGTTLYVTAFGPDGDERDGQLLKITGAF